MKYDLVVKNGMVVDPSQGLHCGADVAIAGGKIAAVAPGLDASEAARVVDATGKLVTPGFIDFHVHVYTSRPNRPGLDADSTSLANGATTVLDAGTLPAGQFPHFLDTDIRTSKCRVLSLIRMPDPNGPTPATIAETAEMIREHPDVLIGVKYHHSQHYPSLPLAREAADFAGGMLMCEAYGPPIPHLLEYLGRGDALTHTFHAWFRMPLFDRHGRVFQEVRQAVEDGVVLDVGHGSRGFSFRTMERAMEQGVGATTISTDLHTGNVDGPVYDMPTTMSKFLALGMSLDEVIERSTSVPAKLLGREGEIGTLKVGSAGDVVVSELAQGEHVFLDVLHEKRVGRERILPEVVIAGGEVYDGPRYEPKEMTHEADAPPGFIDGGAVSSWAGGRRPWLRAL